MKLSKYIFISKIMFYKNNLKEIITKDDSNKAYILTLKVIK